MKKPAPMKVFRALCAFSLLMYWVSGLPFERGPDAGLWVFLTAFVAVGIAGLWAAEP